MSCQEPVGNAAGAHWHRVPSAPFATHARWWAAVCRHLVPDAIEPRTVTLRGRAALCLPLQAARAPFTICLPNHDHLSLNDVAIASELSLEDVGPALDALLEAPGVASGARRSTALAWRGTRIPDDSRVLEALRREQSSGQSTRWSCREVAATAWFDLHEGALPLPGKLRRNLKRLERGLRDQGSLAFEVHDLSDPASLHSAFEAFLQLEAAGWKGAGGSASTAILHHPHLRAFYTHLLDEQDETLQPQISLLRLDAEVIAAQYTLRSGPVLSVLKIAYDERYARFSPGSQLLSELMAHARDSGVTRLSLVTCPAWADRWHPNRAPVWHITRYADSSGGRALARWDSTHQNCRALLARQRSRLRAFNDSARASATSP